MKKTLAILAGATALTALLGLPAWSALAGGAAAPRPATLQAEEMKGLLRLVDDDEGEDDDMPKVQRSEHDDDAAGEDDDEDEDGGSAGGANNPAPAGTVPPPSNGLFGNGAAPKAQVN